MSVDRRKFIGGSIGAAIAALTVRLPLPVPAAPEPLIEPAVIAAPPSPDSPISLKLDGLVDFETWSESRLVPSFEAGDDWETVVAIPGPVKARAEFAGRTPLSSEDFEALGKRKVSIDLSPLAALDPRRELAGVVATGWLYSAERLVPVRDEIRTVVELWDVDVGFVL